MGTLAEQLARVFPSHIKPSNPSNAPRVFSGSLSEFYTVHYVQGDKGKYHPSRKPNDRVVNSFHVSETARTFGVRSRI